MLRSMRCIENTLKGMRHRISVGKYESVGRYRCRWEDSIKIDLKELVCDDFDFVNQAQCRRQWLVLVNMLIDTIKGLEFIV